VKISIWPALWHHLWLASWLASASATNGWRRQAGWLSPALSSGNISLFSGQPLLSNIRPRSGVSSAAASA